MNEYDKYYFERAQRPGVGGALGAWVARLDVTLLSRRLSSGGRGGKLLEIGFGDGSFLEAMAARGWDAHGIDTAGAAVAAAGERPSIVVERGDILDKAYEGESFDLVVMRHVLEHVRDPQATLEEVWRTLKPGGEVCIIVPNIESIEAKIGKEQWFHLDPGYHLSHFSPGILRGALVQAGFRDVRLGQMHVEYRQTLTYSIMSRIGLEARGPEGGFVSGHRQCLFYAFLPVGIVLSFALSLAGRGGTLRATARK